VNKMRDRSTKLRHEVSVYKMIEMENELAEKDRMEEFVKNAYCEIVSQGNKETKTPAGTEYNEQTYRLTFRKQSISEIKKDWYFMHRNNKYKVIYWNEDFTNREFIEVFCRRIDE
jgi:hypothetical protein fulcA4_04389